MCGTLALCCGCLFLPLVYLAFLLLGRWAHFLGDPADLCSELARSHLSSSWETKRLAGVRGGGVILGIISVYTFERPSVLRF